MKFVYKYVRVRKSIKPNHRPKCVYTYIFSVIPHTVSTKMFFFCFGINERKKFCFAVSMCVCGDTSYSLSVCSISVVITLTTYCRIIFQITCNRIYLMRARDDGSNFS